MDLGEALAGRGHEVHLLARHSPMGRRAFAPGVVAHFLGGNGHGELSARLDTRWSPWDLRAFSRLVAAVAADAALDVVHFHYGFPFAGLAAGLRRRLGARSPRVVGTLHGTDVSGLGRRPRRTAALAAHLAAADALTTVSKSHARLAVRILGLGRPPVIVPNFVDHARFRPLPQGGPGARLPRGPRVVHVSNFRPVKAPEGVARVFARLPRHLDAELWLVGDGERVPAVRRLLSEAGVADRGRWFGLTPRVEDILPWADLLLLTSRTESFGLVALEAGACGLPVVAPRVGGLPEVVRHGMTGLLFEPGDEDGAVRAVGRLLSDSELRASMGRSARRWAGAFNRDAVVARYEELYERLMGGGPVALATSEADG